MVQRTGGFRRKTRSKLRKNVRARGKLNITKYLKQFDIGQRVFLVLDSAVHKGMPMPRFMGRSGTVKEKQGECYKVEVKDGKLKKSLLVHPIHLKGEK